MKRSMEKKYDGNFLLIGIFQNSRPDYLNTWCCFSYKHCSLFFFLFFTELVYWVYCPFPTTDLRLNSELCYK